MTEQDKVRPVVVHAGSRGVNIAALERTATDVSTFETRLHAHTLAGLRALAADEAAEAVAGLEDDGAPPPVVVYSLEDVETDRQVMLRDGEIVRHYRTVMNGRMVARVYLGATLTIGDDDRGCSTCGGLNGHHGKVLPHLAYAGQPCPNRHGATAPGVVGGA